MSNTMSNTMSKDKSRVEFVAYVDGERMVSTGPYDFEHCLNDEFVELSNNLSFAVMEQVEGEQDPFGADLSEEELYEMGEVPSVSSKEEVTIYHA